MACELTIIRSSSENEALRERDMLKEEGREEKEGGRAVVDRIRSQKLWASRSLLLVGEVGGGLWEEGLRGGAGLLSCFLWLLWLL